MPTGQQFFSDHEYYRCNGGWQTSYDMKEAYYIRPPAPRYIHSYVCTWHVQVVLGYYEGLGPTSSLPLRLLILKLMMLLVLTRPSHSAALAALQLNRHHYKPEGVVFLLASLAKQSSQGRALKEFLFHHFHTILLTCVLWQDISVV